MFKSISRLGTFATVALLCAPQTQAQSTTHTSDTPEASVHVHTSSEKDIYNGKFQDHEVEARTLLDWQGEWQSLYPYLENGTLDPFIEFKVEHDGKVSDEYRAFLNTGYKTDVTGITINGSEVSFQRGDKTITASYETDGYEVLVYSPEKRGLRYIFVKAYGDEAAPSYIQFSDHIISPQPAEHFHLFWGEDRADVLDEMTNWPTYYPSNKTGKEILDTMLSHAH